MKMGNRCLTTEEIYQIWINESNKLRFGGPGKRIKNFDLIKKRPIWSYFEKFNRLIQESKGQIKPELYVKALFAYFGNRLPDIKLLTSPKGISIYKDYLKERKLDKFFLKMKKTPEDSLVPKPEKIQDWIDFADSPVLRGIGGVKAPGSTAFVTPEQAAFYAREIKKCKEDPVYFAEKYFTIVSFKGKEKIKLFEKQKDMLRSFIDNPFSIVLSARQSGKCVDGSTVITIRDKKTKRCRNIKIESLFRKVKSMQHS